MQDRAFFSHCCSRKRDFRPYIQISRCFLTIRAHLSQISVLQSLQQAINTTPTKPTYNTQILILHPRSSSQLQGSSFLTSRTSKPTPRPPMQSPSHVQSIAITTQSSSTANQQYTTPYQPETDVIISPETRRTRPTIKGIVSLAEHGHRKKTIGPFLARPLHITQNLSGSCRTTACSVPAHSANEQ